jgi:hypothetical protein
VITAMRQGVLTQEGQIAAGMETQGQFKQANQR